MEYIDLIKHRGCDCEECRREIEFWNKLESESAEYIAKVADKPLEEIEKLLDEHITSLAEHMAVFGTQANLFKDVG